MKIQLGDTDLDFDFEDLKQMAKLSILENIAKVLLMFSLLYYISNLPLALAIFTFINSVVFEKEKILSIFNSVIVFVFASIVNPASILEAVGVYYLMEIGREIAFLLLSLVLPE